MMQTEYGLAIGLAIISLAALPGWYSLQQRRAGHPIVKNIAMPWVKQAAIFFYFVGLPYLALVLGILTPQSLGLTGLDYFLLINWQSSALAAQLQQAVTLMLLEWLLDSTAVILAGAAALLLLVVIWHSLTRSRVKIELSRQSALNTIYAAVHWAFYRAIFWTITGDLYLGIVWGTLFTMLEWGLTCYIRGQWRARQQQFLVDTMLLISTGTIFFYSPNLWLLLPMHWAMVALTNRRWAAKAVSGAAG